MSALYWNQWSQTELMSMHGIDEDESVETECEMACNEGFCPCCGGSGCNKCLMLEW